MSTELQDHGKDPEIVGAYERLGASLGAPVDVMARVERRIHVRRRRRVAARGGVALAALGAASVVVGLAVGGGEPGDSHVADQPSGPASTLTITRLDGSTYTFQDVTVRCAGDAASGQQKILASSPSDIVGNAPREPFFTFEAVLGEVVGGRSFTLPYESVDGSSDDRAMTLFIDSDEGGPRGNELSSAEAGATGTVRVVSASCGASPSLVLSVDAVLGSEVEQPPMKVAGELR